MHESGVQADSLSTSLSLQCHAKNVSEDEVVAICAFDGERIVGRLLVQYFDLLVEGRYRRCSVGSSFMVVEDYRKSAVGLPILLKAMKLDVPYVEIGVSGQLQKLLSRLKAFKCVDDSPIYQVGLDSIGIKQIAKWDLYSGIKSKNIFLEQLEKIAHLSQCWRHYYVLKKNDQRHCLFLKGKKAIEYFAGDFSLARYPVQIPWNRETLARGFSGDDKSFGAWLVSFDAIPEQLWLITIYRRDRVLGYGPNGEPKILKEAHLNEIYPPLESGDPDFSITIYCS